MLIVIILLLIIGCSNTTKVNDNYSFYPNPCQDVLTINIYPDIPLSYNVKVHSINGQIVLNQTFINTIATSTLIIDVSNFSSGIYIMNLLYDNTQIKFKFTVSR